MAFLFLIVGFWIHFPFAGHPWKYVGVRADFHVFFCGCFALQRSFRFGGFLCECCTLFTVLVPALASGAPSPLRLSSVTGMFDRWRLHYQILSPSFLGSWFSQHLRRALAIV